MKTQSEQSNGDHPLFNLKREDLDLVTELVLQSGSLKGLAQSYGVSYPTIRLRLNEMIERLRAVVEGRESDPVAELLGQLIQSGELSLVGARKIKGLIDGLRETANGDEA